MKYIFLLSTTIILLMASCIRKSGADMGNQVKGTYVLIEGTEQFRIIDTVILRALKSDSTYQVVRKARIWVFKNGWTKTKNYFKQEWKAKYDEVNKVLIGGEFNVPIHYNEELNGIMIVGNIYNKAQ